MDNKTLTQQIEVAGDKLVDEIKKLYDDASARKVILKDSHGKEIFTLPLTVGIGGAAIAAIAAPALAAVAAVGGIVAKVKLEIERTDDPAKPQDPTFPLDPQDPTA